MHRCLCILLAGLLTLAAAPSPAAEALVFGAPVQAEYPSTKDGLLALSRETPPRELAAGAEIILVSGYEPANVGNKGTAARVTVNRPGARVLLVLSSYETVLWQVTATERTTLAGILVGGYQPSAVSANVKVPAFRVSLPYARQTDNIEFTALLRQLDQLFGVGKVDAFRGSYTIPAETTIAALDAPGPELTLAGPAVTRPARNFVFYLTDSQYRRVPWTLTGPVENREAARDARYSDSGPLELSPISDRLWTLAPDGGTLYRLGKDQLNIKKLHDGASETVDLPPNFPRFSWASGMAYDSRRDIVSVVSFGGEGCLYRYSVKTGRWLDFRSLNNVDFHSLAYDAQNDRYIGWVDFGPGDLVFFSGEGEALFSRRVADRLPGFGRLYDSGNGPRPALAVFPHGDELALVAFAGGGMPRPGGAEAASVQAIWLYNVARDQAALTYKAQ